MDSDAEAWKLTLRPVSGFDLFKAQRMNDRMPTPEGEKFDIKAMNEKLSKEWSDLGEGQILWRDRATRENNDR